MSERCCPPNCDRGKCYDGEYAYDCPCECHKKLVLDDIRPILDSLLDSPDVMFYDEKTEGLPTRSHKISIAILPFNAYEGTDEELIHRTSCEICSQEAIWELHLSCHKNGGELFLCDTCLHEISSLDTHRNDPGKTVSIFVPMRGD